MLDDRLARRDRDRCRARCRPRPDGSLTDALDVRLVDDGLAPRHIRRAVVTPVELVVDDHRLRHAASRVVDVARQVLGSAAESIAENRHVPIDVAADAAGVRIEQQLVGVEAQALAWGVAAVHAVAVQLARARCPAGTRATRCASARASRSAPTPCRASRRTGTARRAWPGRRTARSSSPGHPRSPRADRDGPARRSAAFGTRVDASHQTAPTGCTSSPDTAALNSLSG